LLALSAILSLILSYIPFVYNHFDEFWESNPFLFQSIWFVPFYYTILFAAIALAFSFFCKKKTDAYFYSGLALFLSISIYFIYNVCVGGFYHAYFESVIDVSYFIFCVPFALYHYASSLQESNQDCLEL
jgi:uncharacterized membrane protein